MAKKRIIWNQVTWYSKSLAAAILIVLPILSFYLGIRVGFSMAEIPPPVVNLTYAPKTEASTTEKQYVNRDLGFALSYPANWKAEEDTDPYTLLEVAPLRSLRGGAIKIYLEKNVYKNIVDLKSQIDSRVGTEALSVLRDTKDFEAISYGNLSGSAKGSAVMYAILSDKYVIGISGPDEPETWRMFETFRKL